MAPREPTFILEGPEDAPNDPLIFGSSPNSKVTGPEITPPDFAGAVDDLIQDPKRLLECVIGARREAGKMRAPTLDLSTRAYEMYHNDYDYSNKEAWQSKKSTSKMFVTVERLTSVICRIREKSSDWLDAEATQEDLQIFYSLVKNATRQQLDHDDVNFDEEYRTAVKSGCLSNMLYMWVGWQDGGVSIFNSPTLSSGSPSDETSQFTLETLSGLSIGKEAGFPGGGDSDKPDLPSKKMPRLEIKALNPDYVYLDPYGDRFKILEIRYPRGRAMQIAKDSGWDLEACRKALRSPREGSARDDADPYSGTYEARDSLKQDRPSNEKDNMVRCTYYFGDIFDDETGETLMENCFGVCWNDSQWVHGPEPMPFWDGEDPIVAAPLIKVPFATYGRSPICMSLDMLELWNEWLNMLVDYFRAVLLGMREIDMDLIQEWDEDFRSGLFPGKFIRTNKRGQQGQAITTVPFSDIPPGMVQLFPLFQKEISEDTLLADTLGGMPRQRGRVTAMEFNKRAAEAGSVIDFIGEGLQSNFLSKIGRKAFHRILQFMPQKLWSEFVMRHAKKLSPRPQPPNQPPQAPGQPPPPANQDEISEWEKIMGEVAGWDERTRWEKLAGYWKFRSKVYSALGDRQEDIEKGTFLMQTIAQIPQAAQAVRWDRMLRYIVRAFDWDPEEILNPDYVPLPAWASTQTPEGQMEAPEAGTAMGMSPYSGFGGDLGGSGLGEGGHIPGPMFQGMPSSMPSAPPGFAPPSYGLPG